jgi:hypothetical protein
MAHVQQDEFDPVLQALQSAPFDDELETSEEREAVARAREDAKNGRVCSTAELIHDLGL